MENHAFVRKSAAVTASALTALLAFTPSLTCFAEVTDFNGDTIETVVSGDYEYSVMVDSENKEKMGACIEKYLGNETNVVIPDVLDDKEVIAFGDSAFAGNYTLKSVTLPVNLIGLGDFAFAECTALEEFITPEDSIFFESRDGVLYTKDGKWLVRCPISKIEPNMTVDEGIEQVCSSAFAYSRVLETVSLPSTLTAIGAAAFSDCVSLKSVEIPEGVKEIKNFTFYRCVQLTDIKMSDAVTSIGDGAFAETALSTFKIPSACKTIGQAAFAATKLKSIAIPNGVEEIGSSAFGYNIDSSREFYPVEDFVIYGALGTAAARYAKDVEEGNSFEFAENGEPVTTDAPETENSGDTSESSANVETTSEENVSSDEPVQTQTASISAKNQPDSGLGENKGLIIGIIAGGVVVLCGIIFAIVKVLRGGKDENDEK